MRRWTTPLLSLLTAAILGATEPAQLPVGGPLHAVVPALFGVPVLPYDGTAAAELRSALERTLAVLREEGVVAPRPNEVGNRVEAVLLDALRGAGFSADRPQARSGRRRSAGYPDLEATLGTAVLYLEVKTYHPDTADSSQRTFYLSPSDDPKVTRPAFHLLVAFAMEADADGIYHARSARLLDLHDLEIALKWEYNAGNDDLYGDRPQLTVFEVGNGESSLPVRELNVSPP